MRQIKLDKVSENKRKSHFPFFQFRFKTGIIFLLVWFSSSFESVKIICEFKYKTWPIIGHSYTCQVLQLNITQPNQSITKVSGIHQTRLTFNHVRSLDIQGQTCDFFPHRIKNFFQNLELLHVQNSKLKEITQADLKPLIKLRVLHLGANQLVTLENNLFAFNSELVRIDFKNQKLKLIGYNILEGLHKLAIADFESSGCVNFYAQHGRREVEKLKREIRINCQLPIDDVISEVQMLRAKVSVLEAAQVSIDEKMKSVDYDNDPFFRKLAAKFSKMERDSAQCLENSEVATKSFLTVMERVESFEKSLKGKTQNCAAHEIADERCQLENENLQRLKREMSAVDVECESADWISKQNIHTCNVKRLKVVHPDVEIKMVTLGNRKQRIDTQSIDDLRIFNQQTIFFPINLGRTFINLKFLSFVDCGLIEVSQAAFKGLAKLQSLVLTSNKIKSIASEAFMELSALKLLDLSKNKLESLKDGTFNHLIELTEFRMNDNQLIELSATVFFKQTKLKFLFLKNNKLSVIAPTLIDSTTKLELADFLNNDCVNFTSTKSSAVTLKQLKVYFDENCAVFQ